MICRRGGFAGSKEKAPAGEPWGLFLEERDFKGWSDMSVVLSDRIYTVEG
ncbi:MAG: hypothetical protein GX425_15530 [Peptococcaceae bacterium]|nr:hypothetical protein [Peptococcaceae bacterium]